MEFTLKMIGNVNKIREKFEHNFPESYFVVSEHSESIAEISLSDFSDLAWFLRTMGKVKMENHYTYENNLIITMLDNNHGN
jgi:hypothetical protein